MSAPKYTIGQRVHANGIPGTGRIRHIDEVLGQYTYTIEYSDRVRYAAESRIVLVVPEEGEVTA